MKYNISFFIAFIFLCTAIHAQQVNKTFSVSGNCGMCKKTIESAAIKQGAVSANWEKKTQSIMVSFDPNVVTEAAIKQAIADAGYDNEGFKANEASYTALPDCCKYRAEKSETQPKPSKCKKDGDCKSNKKCCKQKCEEKCCEKKGTKDCCKKKEGCKSEDGCKH
jgi:hypothetical protein